MKTKATWRDWLPPFLNDFQARELHGYLEKHYYVPGQGPQLERVTEPIFDTEDYHSQVTTELHFFGNLYHKSRARTNMYIPNMLPNPTIAVVHDLFVWGVSTALASGVLTLQIGAKVYGSIPLWTLQPGLTRRPRKFQPLLIGPLQIFKVSILWDKPATIGDANSDCFATRPIQVVMPATKWRAIA